MQSHASFLLIAKITEAFWRTLVKNPRYDNVTSKMLFTSASMIQEHVKFVVPGLGSVTSSTKEVHGVRHGLALTLFKKNETPPNDITIEGSVELLILSIMQTVKDKRYFSTPIFVLSSTNTEDESMVNCQFLVWD